MKWQKNDVEALTARVMRGELRFALGMLSIPGLPPEAASRLHHAVSQWEADASQTAPRQQLLERLAERLPVHHQARLFEEAA